MPDVTPPEIQRTSLVGAVLYLKSLQLPGLDVLDFGFLDPPAQEVLEVGRWVGGGRRGAGGGWVAGWLGRLGGSYGAGWGARGRVGWGGVGWAELCGVG